MKWFATLMLLAASASAAGITGTVTSEPGAPLSGMTVAIYAIDGTLAASGTTGANGTYNITLPAGSYRALAYDPAGAYATSFYDEAESFETSATLRVTTTPLSNIDFQLVHAGFAAGRVTSTTGAALQNMTVAAYNLSGTRRGFTTTNAAGSFTLVLPPGSYKIAAYDDALKYAKTFFADAASFGAANVVAIAAAESTTANLRLTLAATVSGSVTDRATAATLAGMRVTAYASDGSIAGRALTGSDGRFAFAVRPGSIRVVVDDPSGIYATLYLPDAESFSAEAAVSAAAGQTMTANASLVRAAHIEGTISDRATGAPLAGITATAYNADGSTRSFATTSASGAYSIVVPPGDYRAGASDDALVYLPQFYANALAFGAATVEHAITSIGGIDFALVKGARVAGQVTAAASQQPLGGITVGVYDIAGHLLQSAVTDASGRYALLRESGTVKLLAFDPALQFANAYYLDATSFAASPAVPLAEGDAVTADFAMSAAGRVNGGVMDAASTAPVAGIELFAYDASFNAVAETISDANGAFRLALPPGTYTLAAADPAQRYESTTLAQPVTVAAGEDVGPVQIRLTVAKPLPVPPRRRAARH
jgi:hypothetical protein